MGQRAEAFFNAGAFWKKPSGSGQTSNGYTIGQSLRFNGSSSYLKKTPGTAGNQQTWTLSCWVKRSGLSDGGVIFASSTSGTDASWLYFQASTDALYWQDYVGGNRLELKSTASYRDASAWYHIVIALDTTQSTSTNRAKIFVNGSQITSFAMATYPSQNASLLVNTANRPHTLGVTDYDGGSFSNFFNGYISETYFVDGQALDAASFGQLDSNSGQWIPKKYSGTYGTNGFYLNFANADVPGKDSRATATTLSSSSSGIWLGSLSSFNFSGTDISTNSGDHALKSSTTLNGDFDIIFKFSAPTATVGVWDTSQDGAFDQNSELIVSMTTSFWAIRIGGSSPNGDFYYGGSKITSCPSSTAGDVFRLSRRGSTFYGYQNEVLRHTFTQTSAATVRVGFSSGGSYRASVKNLYWSDGSSGTLGNNFDWSNLTSFDQVLDSPTNNFCTFNPLDKNGSGFAGGNLKYTYAAAGTLGRDYYRATMGFSTGQWEWQVTNGTNGTSYIFVGIAAANSSISGGFPAKSYYWTYSGALYANLSATVASGWGGGVANGDVIKVRFNNGSLEFFKNGVSQGVAFSGIPATETWVPFMASDGPGASGQTYDFGQNGFTPSTGYKTLCTLNLPAPAIKKPSQCFNAVTYTGNGTSQTISSLAFQPDLLWFKNRTSAQSHALQDSVRGVGAELQTDTTNSDGGTGGLTSINSNGFTISNGTRYNALNDNYAAWCWKAGGSAVTNNAGSITSQVSVSTTTGFSIVSWTGAGSAASIGHGLGATPRLVVAKRRNGAGTENWRVFHSQANASPATGGVYLNLNNAFTADSTLWNNTTPTSTLFYVGTDPAVNASGGTYIAYLWVEVAGFSKFGSYTGNNNTDGPFVYCGFKPRLVLIKRTDASVSYANGSWYIVDTTRNPSNVAYVSLLSSDNSVQEYTENAAITWDILSNGFKIRGSYSSINASGGTYIFAAFADAPFKYATAR
jgi:hypothetical protein